MATRALAHHWADTGITVTCFSPGFVATGFGRGEGGWLEGYYRFVRLFARPPKRGARTLVTLALSPDIKTSNGAYLEGGRIHRVGGVAADASRCEELLGWSARMTGFNPARI